MNHSLTISIENKAPFLQLRMFCKNPHGRRRRGGRFGGSLEEGARGGVGRAKQNIDGSKRLNFCARPAPPTSPDRLNPQTFHLVAEARPMHRND